MLKFDENNMFDSEQLDQYNDIIRYCRQCKKGKKLTPENFSPNIVDMFRLDLTCKSCEKLNKVESKKFRAQKI